MKFAHLFVVSLALVGLTLLFAESGASQIELNPRDPLERRILDLISKHPGVRVLSLNKKARFIELGLNSYLRSGSDAGCREASKLFFQLCSLDGGEFILKVTDVWVPSVVNPMDLKWSRKLAGEAGAPNPVEKLTIKEHQDRVDQAMKERGLVKELRKTQ